MTYIHHRTHTKTMEIEKHKKTQRYIHSMETLQVVKRYKDLEPHACGYMYTSGDFSLDSLERPLL